jgi:acyl-CoA synthetase (AMP-forming)/AMP-acid ligase II
MDFATILRRSRSAYGERVAVTCGEVRQSYGELFERACRLANALAGLGVAAGERVAVLGPNGPETVEQVAGIALGGFVRCALYAHQSAEVNAYLLELVGARALIVHASLAGTLEHEAEQIPSLAHLIVYGGEEPPAAPAHAYEALLERAPNRDPGLTQAPEDVHVIRFSAGTTGRPKGIVHTVSAWLRGGDEFRWVTPQIDERDCYLAAGPLTHAAVVFLWPMLQVGGRVAVMEAFQPARALELIEREHATLTLMVPTMIQALLAEPGVEDADLSSLRCLSYAAAPIGERTLGRALEVLGDGVLHQWYAQSEAWPLTMLLPHQHRERPRSVGRPTPNTTLEIVDAEGRALPAGETGEIAVRTPGQMRGHWSDPEGTAARALPDGKLLTRDIGYRDEQGFVFLVDRKEDMIISGGYNIWPAELEAALARHPAVAEVCVVGIPHERWGETPHAVVVLAPGARASEPELIEHCRASVGSVKKITSVGFADRLPKSPLGKVLRREVRASFWAGAERQIGGA